MPANGRIGGNLPGACGEPMNSFEIIGNPARGGILIVGDHAGNGLPAGVDLHLPKNLFTTHIAWDIGVAAVARRMVSGSENAGRNISAILGVYSRLVVDLNREPDDAAVIPLSSDGREILGNRIDDAERDRRLAHFFHPYHDALARLIADHRPDLLLSLHSFTPCLASKPQERRPWEVGVLYNQDERAARIAIPQFAAAGFVVGDQLPYSGKDLNATMNRHGERTGAAYLGIEMRQDLVSGDNGQARFATILTKICNLVTEKLGTAN